MRPIIIHHNDDDGRCAAALVARDIIPVFNRPTKECCYEYRHGYNLVIDDDAIKNANEIYIVDVAIDPQILGFIDKVVELRGEQVPKITFIDHHQTSLDELHALSDDSNFKKYVHYFIWIGISGTLMTFMYGCFTPEEQKNIPDDFDFTDKYTHFAVHVGKPEQREYKIPWAVRLINDWDVWNHELPETRFFNLGFSMESDKSPMSEIWDSVLYGDDRWLQSKYITTGEVLWKYQEGINGRAMSRAFETEINGVKCLALNQAGNSMVFGDKINEYPMVCLFYYDGVAKLWKYSFYSAEDGGIDVSTIAKTFGGGGHKHASGANTKELIFAL